MASAGPAPGGKRSLDVEYNLVPFIDLLSCCICFLLISAVWTQVAKIDVKPAPNSPSDAPPPDKEQVKLTVHIRSTGYMVSDGGSQVDLPKKGDDYAVTELDGKLKAMREAYPDVTAITVLADDVVPYKSMIEVMDLCLKHKLDDISVSASM